ncbi:MAG TPA: DUF5701 family protein [Actinomycetes bacterium]
MTTITGQAVDAGLEFDRQVDRLLALGYPREGGLTEDAFTELLAPLRDEALARGAAMDEPARDRVPFVVVVTKHVVPAERAMPLTCLRGKPGFVSADMSDVHRFEPIERVDLPDKHAYLLLDVERGDDLLDVRPNDALVTITGRGRTPLTVDEGIALVTAFPEMLEKNHCFSLVASRCGDKRVPALWISKGAPKLGWCWAGNPHTWLGSASCGGRVGRPQE